MRDTDACVTCSQNKIGGWSYAQHIKCQPCEGTGEQEPQKDCPVCKGSGHIPGVVLS